MIKHSSKRISSPAPTVTPPVLPDSVLTQVTPRRIRRAFAAVEEFFVGKSYADTTLPAGTTLSFYHPDHLGSVNLITDHTGKQVELAEYSPFGSLSRSEQAPGAGDNPFHFTGKRLDSSTGLYYYGARYYDPELGRFIQPDSIVQAPSDPQTLNRYTYVRNNPLIYTDPTGHFSWKKFWRAAVGAFVGVVVAILLGPAGLALVGSTMAGIIGGAVGGAITGGLNGGWKGALIGGALGGALGGIGGWAIGGQHYGVLAGMFAAGAGVAGATNSWDSFAGGLVGGVAGAFAGQGIISANSQQFANFRAGKGFISNETLARQNAHLNGGKPEPALSVDRSKRIVLAKARYTHQDTEFGPPPMGGGGGGGRGGAAGDTGYINARGGGGGAGGYRYVGPGEAAVIKNTGRVPNVTEVGDPKPVFVTFDEPLNSGPAAKSIYGLDKIPTHRVGVDTSGARFDYGGNVRQGSTATEGITYQELPATDVTELGQ